MALSVRSLPGKMHDQGYGSANRQGWPRFGGKRSSPQRGVQLDAKQSIRCCVCTIGGRPLRTLRAGAGAGAGAGAVHALSQVSPPARMRLLNQSISPLCVSVSVPGAA